MTQNQVKNFSMLHSRQFSLGSFSFLVINLDLPSDMRNFEALLRLLAEKT